MSTPGRIHPGNYSDDPPATFKCGHPRSRENMAFNGGARIKCKQCSEVYQKTYRMKHAFKPHLYPNQQAA